VSAAEATRHARDQLEVAAAKRLYDVDSEIQLLSDAAARATEQVLRR
jgi:hypothetical protein